MNFQQRQQRYKDAIALRAAKGGVPTKSSDAFGFSNSAKIVEGGLFAFNANFDKLGNDADQLVINCLIRFPPEEEIFFSLFIRSGLQELRQRLAEMKAQGSSKKRNATEEEDEEEGLLQVQSGQSAISYTDNSKNVKGYIGRGGRLYLRNKGFWDALPADLSTIPHHVPVDQIVFAVWPPAVAERRSLFAREFVGYLGNLVGTANVHEELPWREVGGQLNDRMRRMPATLDVGDIESAVAVLGGHYPRGEVRRLHAALNYSGRKHFAILAGLSGSGKTQLALQYARAVHGVESLDAPDPLLFVCPVRPDWTDPTGLTGYPDVLSGKYLVPPFLEALLLAVANPDAPVFVVLDEMNLARVEHYFSDVLSCIEARGELLRLHASSVPLEGSTGISVPAAVPMPKNLFVIGTINIDETTRSLSDKVLDRAQLIEMASIDLPGFLAVLAEREPELANAVGACRPHLESVHSTLQPHGLSFGYRVAEEVVRYVSFASSALAGGREAQSTMDDLMVQKLLAKLRGSERQRQMLTDLRTSLAGMPQASGLLDRMLTELEDFGSFQASR